MLYLPVIHAGYERFLDNHRDAAEVLVLGESFAEYFPVMRKEIRALAPERAAAYLRSTGLVVRVIESRDLPDVVTADSLVVPDEEIMRDLMAKHCIHANFEPTFLRWDRSRSTADQAASYDRRVTEDEVAQSFMTLATNAAQHSSDWWRQVGAVAVRDGVVLGIAHNEHKPTEYAPYIDGDPRNDFSRGIRADLSTAIHAEAEIVGQAARDGVRLAGADLYVSTFPCPACARLVAAAEFARCYYTSQYAVLHGDNILRAAGVELIWVES